MPSSQREAALQMIAQLRLLDPSVSADVGTPERKLLDTFAQAIADNQIDITLLQAQLDFDAKFGANLDRFLTLFRFQRQAPTYATGYVKFGRLVPATSDIRIPSGTLVLAPVPQRAREGSDTDVETVIFTTTVDGWVEAGQSESAAVPIRSTAPGTVGNVAAEAITTFAGDPVFGVTTVTNEVPTQNGLDSETDEELKVRFKNTVFRNLAGTQDQYLALAVATQFSTKANVVGPISRYREYIQVPPVDDSDDYTVGVIDYGDGNGNADEWTTALSTLPYAKHIWSDVPYFVSNGDLGPDAYFFRADTDFTLNTEDADRNRGDAYRLAHLPEPLADDPLTVPSRPNVTFINVYTGTDPDVQAISAEQVVLLEYSYMSAASRNDYERKILNCVDVYVDGRNPTLTSTILPPPTVSSLFVNNINSVTHYDNYRRLGEPEKRPQLGNVLTTLYWQPVVEVPERIVVTQGDNTYTYYHGEHYWGVEDVTELRGTVRARGGIEWSLGVGGEAPGDTVGVYSGPFITEFDLAEVSIAIEDYLYDQNVVDLQGSLEANKQETTDVLAHQAKIRYFKLDVSIMYDPGVGISSTNDAIEANLRAFLKDQYFGSIVQLSDLLQVIHNTSGVDNVRWSSDLPNQDDSYRVTEVDIKGRPLLNALADRRQQASVERGLPEIQQLIITGSPIEGSKFVVSYEEDSTAELDWDISASDLLTALQGITTSDIDTVTGTGSYADPFVITFIGTAERSVFTTTVQFYEGPTVFNQDFILQDDELPALPTEAQAGDAAPGLIIRPRAQHTWVRG